MGNYVTIDDVKVKVTNIVEDPQLNRPSKSIIGGNGSHTAYVGDGGRNITLTIRANAVQIQDYQKLWKKGSPVTLISQSEADYNGFYHVVKFKNTEFKKRAFHVDLTLQEDYQFNVTRQNFVNYNVSPSSNNTQINVGQKWSTDATL